MTAFTPGETPGPSQQDQLTHLDEAGAARMVDVSAKDVTARTARASGRVLVAPRVVELLRGGGGPPGCGGGRGPPAPAAPDREGRLHVRRQRDRHRVGLGEEFPEP
ncbi:hypothetical protein ACFV5M_19495, partial [Streptomyces albidoflavus]